MRRLPSNQQDNSSDRGSPQAQTGQGSGSTILPLEPNEPLQELPQQENSERRVDAYKLTTEDWEEAKQRSLIEAQAIPTGTTPQEWNQVGPIPRAIEPPPHAEHYPTPMHEWDTTGINGWTEEYLRDSWARICADMRARECERYWSIKRVDQPARTRNTIKRFKADEQTS